jgi:hypothetical protein
MYRLGLRNAPLVRELFLDSVIELEDFEPFADGATDAPSAPQPDRALAHAALLRSLADDRERQQLSVSTLLAREDHTAACRRELTDPLRAWAAAGEDPVTQNAGAQMASLYDLLHQMAPMVRELQLRQLDQALTGSADRVSTATIRQYLDLCRQASTQIRDLRRWNKFA